MFLSKKNIIISTLITVLCANYACAAKLPELLSVSDDGRMKIHDTDFSIRWYLPGWKCTVQSPRSVKAEIVRSESEISIDGTFLNRGSKVAFKEIISSESDNSFKYSAFFKAEKAIKTQDLSLVVRFPATYAGKQFSIGGGGFTFPAKYYKRVVIPQRRCKFFATKIKDFQLVIKGNYNISLQNNRGKCFYLKIMFSPQAGNITNSSLTLKMILNDSEKIQTADTKNFYITPGKDWQAIQGITPEVKKGSALDFSFMQDAPAGKYGRVVTRNGHFELEKKPGERFRLYGVNLCFDAQYLDKKECERLVATLSRIGYNSIRIHHYENHLIKRGAKSSTDLDPDKLDKLDYLFYCCKKAGIYLAIDFYCNRSTRNGEFKGVKAGKRFKSMMPVDDRFLESWKTFTRKLLTHKNPYTNMTWGEDPALAIASMVNEDTIYVYWKRDKQFIPVYQKAFEDWIKKNGYTFKNKKLRLQAMAKFLTELQISMYKKMQDFVKNELKSKVLLTGVNYKNAEAQSFIREKLDYVDNHSYFNHPRFAPGKYWKFPAKFTNGSPVACFANAVRDAANARIFGKPFTITEFNYVAPNAYRGQGGAVMGSLASAQNWDGLYRFAYAHKKRYLFNQTTIRYFDIVSDPLNLLSERIGLALFLRKDVKASPEKYLYIYDDSAYKLFHDFSKEAGRFPYRFNNLALLGQLGCIDRDKLSQLNKKNTKFFNSVVSSDDKYPRWTKNNSIYEKLASANEIKNSNGQITFIRKKKLLKVISPCSEAYCVEEKGSVNGNFMSIENQSGFATMFICSLSEQSLIKSKRMLMLQLPDIQNSYTKFISDKRRLLLNWGKLPLLQSHSRVKVTLKIPGNIEIWALALDGSRLFKIPYKESNDKIMFTLDNFRLKNAMAYEIIKL